MTTPARHLARPLLAALLAIAFAGPAAAAASDAAIDTATGRPLDADALDRRLLEADVVILGEIHDSADHHHRQAAVIAMLAREGRRPPVVFEMLTRAQQPAIDAFRAASRPAQDFAEAVSWTDNWNDWPLYAPVIAAALAAGGPILGGDLPREARRRVGREGTAGLPAAERARYGLDDDLPAAYLADLSGVLLASHCGMIPEEAIGAMVDVQRLRDGAMADAARAALGEDPTARPVVVIAGAAHARRDWGLPPVLERLAPELDVVSLAYVANRSDIQRDALGKPLHDIEVPTLADSPVGDPCEGMRKPS
ncbi:ChaN family lipoprotein [Methylobrevis pamukkalensis]|uniref:Haem-binding uptake Tiki superfamily ChaN domain-containing protein n=1 Tax=Methylobrevis pamukkalensis TaxID=1439726 RepID=A0A1E3H373_9HYPH|nr:ChaN family lipoprotein [Methylobrevis pamukkalensis]ODN70787.1 hypothetical protein A6302_01891 [Methylobrevis pamukkalensis]